MRQRWLTTGGLALAALAFATAGAAQPGPGRAQGGENARQFTLSTSDDGSCRQTWANDTVRRTYRVKQVRDGYRVERRDRGVFVTVGSRSPGACEPGRHGATVRAGIRGRLRGDLVGIVTGGAYDAGAECTGADCGFTDVWIATHFGAGATFSCLDNSRSCRFAFEYTASARGLRFSHWSDRGTGSGTRLVERLRGDIADR